MLLQSLPAVTVKCLETDTVLCLILWIGSENLVDWEGVEVCVPGSKLCLGWRAVRVEWVSSFVANSRFAI